jgi:hypothetical protein
MVLLKKLINLGKNHGLKFFFNIELFLNLKIRNLNNLKKNVHYSSLAVF